MSDELVFTPAHELLRLYARRKLSPVEVTEAVFDRIDRHGEALNAFVMTDRDAAMQAARESEARWRVGEFKGLVDGVPVSIKDLLLTKDWPTLRGSLTVDPHQAWDEDAPSVARLREHGAVLIGKTTTPEFGHKGVTDSRLTGITRNPWNREMTPGGSSGGAGAAVAAGMGPLALGSDGGGSIRIPASYCGIYGLKASFGRVPSYPASPFGTLSHVGPMTRTVTDAALLLSVIAEPDHRDWYALPYEQQDYREGLEGNIRGLRIAFSRTLGSAKVQIQPDVAQAFEDALATFRELGAEVEEIDISWPSDIAELFGLFWSVGLAKLVEGLRPDQLDKVDRGLLRDGERGRAIDGMAVRDSDMRRAAIGAYMNELFGHRDLLLTPAMPVTAFAAGERFPAPEYAEDPLGWIPFSYPFNLTKQPAASIPCGMSGDGLPIGLQIVGPMYGEMLVLHASRAFEKARPWADRTPDLT